MVLLFANLYIHSVFLLQIAIVQSFSLVVVLPISVHCLHVTDAATATSSSKPSTTTQTGVKRSSHIVGMSFYYDKVVKLKAQIRLGNVLYFL